MKLMKCEHDYLVRRFKKIDYTLSTLRSTLYCYDGDTSAARVRVIIESRDKNSIWGTVGVSENIIEASWQALVDSVEYKLQKDMP